jgi:hypothetical protein
LPGGTKVVAYSDLVAPLIAAIKKFYHKWFDDSKVLHREIASVKSENAQLKARADKAEKENAAIKAYLCGKDHKAAFCK